MNTKFHNVESVGFDGGSLVLRVDGKVFRVAVAAVSERLTHANEAARRNYRISPSGYGIHWLELDEDLSVDGLIRVASGLPARPETQKVYVMKDEPKK
ncbi:MAG: DUF2442 domain-containing protein [Verrucomicrobia bacterium]|nr:DUF2442 domain-containing protein [Verrucomicrobiota bacterium]